jgi:hypothetical protein
MLKNPLLGGARGGSNWGKLWDKCSYSLGYLPKGKLT